MNQGAVESILKNGKITSSGIETSFLVLGTDSGDIHVLSFVGQHIQRLRAHSQPVVSLSLCFSDGSLTVLSCSSDGRIVSTVVTGKDMRDTALTLADEPTSVCVENVLPVGRRDRSFLVGTSKGSLYYHRTSWFSSKVVTLFNGEGSAVSSIVWRGNLVAWADASVVRIMDISTQTAICQLPAPHGVGSDDPYPCHLYWRSDNELMVSWADSFKLLRVRTAAEEGLSIEGGAKAAKTIIEWTADCILCGVFPLDEEHVVCIGYTPPDEAIAQAHAEARDLLEEGQGQLSPAVAARFSNTNEPEVIVATLKTGTIISADLLPLRGVNLDGPGAYKLLSSHQCTAGQGSSDDSVKWRLRQASSTGPPPSEKGGAPRGGDRGNAPLLFIVAPGDLVVGRVRDVNDRVRSALEQKDLKHAVEIALADRQSLRVYSFAELLSLYLNHLLDRGLSTVAATEASRLIGLDAVLWESWIYRFLDCGHIDTLCLLMPVDKPRLRNDVYELVLDAVRDLSPSLFLQAVRKWAKTSPPLFDHNKMISKLASPLSRDQRTPFLEAQAHLYLVAQSHEKALNCYLQINASDQTGDRESGGRDKERERESKRERERDSEREKEGSGEYRHVFELIEKQNLFKLVEGKVINLVRLSRSLSAKLLLHHIDKLPIRTIAFQLAVDRRLLHWYLHLVFTDSVARELYQSPDYEDLHKRQAELYAEFAPPFQRPLITVGDSVTLSSSDSSVVDMLRVKQAMAERKRLFESDFLVFIKSGLAPLDVCLSECEKRYPPLYPEIIVCLSLMDKRRTALAVLLREIGDVGLAIQFIENQLDNTSSSALANMKRFGVRAQSTASAANASTVTPSLMPLQLSEDERAMQDALLWNDLIQHALDNPVCLENLLDHLGVSKVDAKKVLSKIAPNTQIPHLRPRLMRILKELTHQRRQDQFCKEILQKDATELLCRKNHGQRRAIKVDNALRCSSCLRPLLMEPALSSSHHLLSAGSLHNLLPTAKENIQVWGHANGGHSAVIFSNKLAFHRQCFDHLS